MANRFPLPPADLTKCVVAVLLRGTAGTGVGRAEAQEFARRYEAATTVHVEAVKNHQEWFFVPMGKDVGVGGGLALSLGQVADFLYSRERGRPASIPTPKYALRVEERP